MLLPVRVHAALLLVMISAAACDLRCNAESQVEVGIDPEGNIERSADGKLELDRKAAGEGQAAGEGKAAGEGEAEAVRPVEVESTVCDAIDLEIEKIVLVRADPPFHDVPRERVSIRITNTGAEAVQLDSGTDASFLDERRTLVKADLHQSDWFMPLTLPAKSATVVEIHVAEGAGKTLRTVEVEVSPKSDRLTDCKLEDGLLARAPGATPI